MSVDRHLRIGPYARCVDRPRTRAVAERGCPTHGAKYDRPGPHCQICGAPFVEISREVPCVVDPYDLIGDELSGHRDIAYLYLFPNGGRKGAPGYGEDVRSEFHVDSADLTIAADIAWFEREYADELVKLRAAYDDVEVRWGVHQWFL